MELSYRELSKRDVINIADGRCLGRIIDIKLIFPQGKLIGIVVPGKKVKGIFRCFDKSEMYIDEKNIIKIGGDVILVDIRCNEDCSPRPPRPIKPNKLPKHPSPCDKHNNDCFNAGLSQEQFMSSFDDNDY